MQSLSLQREGTRCVEEEAAGRQQGGAVPLAKREGEAAEGSLALEMRAFRFD